MKMVSLVHELWDIETGNLLGDYLDEDAALHDVREGIQEDGRDLWSAIALARVEADGTRNTIAQGDELIARAQGTPMMRRTAS